MTTVAVISSPLGYCVAVTGVTPVYSEWTVVYWYGVSINTVATVSVSLGFCVVVRKSAPV